LDGTHIKTEYGLKTSEFIQIWDSYTSHERFNLGKTIWTITQTPKTGFIPSWTFFENDERTPEFSLQNEWVQFEGNMENSNVHHMTNFPAVNFQGLNEAFFDFDSYSVNNIVALTGDEFPRIQIMGFNEYNILEEVISDLAGFKWTDILLKNVNNYFDNNQNYLASQFKNFLITSAFGELDSDSNGSELITFPWHKDHIFTGSVTEDPRLMPLLWRQNITGGLSTYNSSVFPPEPLDNLIEAAQVSIFKIFLFSSTTYPSGAIGDMDNDGDNDIIISNGNFLLLENIGNATDPFFSTNLGYFQELNQKSPSLPLFSPQIWDHNLDGNLDIIYSFGLVNKTRPPGVDFFINEGANERGEYSWSRFSQMFDNQFNSSTPYPASIKYNNFSLGTLIPTIDDPETTDIDERYSSSGTSFWIYREDEKIIRLLHPNTENSYSFMAGTNPELMKLEINKYQDPPRVTNMGFSISKSWDNLFELSNWTLALTGGNLDLDNQNEVIIADFDNNVYVFEHLLNNTYKRAYKTPDLVQLEETDYSPFRWEDLPGVEAQLSPFGKFVKTNYKHADLVAAGLDSDVDGREEFVVAAGLILYVFENTGIDDEYEQILNYDIRDALDLPDNSSKKITALAITNEFDGRGGMISLAMENYMFLLRNDPLFGWLESFQIGSHFLTPGYSQSSLFIQTLAFFDLNQDDKVELWMGGINSTRGKNGFLIALQSDFGNIYWVYSVPILITDNSPITDVKMTDSNYNGLNEIVVAHENGIDIWESNQGNPISLSQLNSLSGSPTYQTSSITSFDPYRANVTLGKRSNVMEKINSTHYLVVYSENDGQTSDPWDSAIRSTGEGSLYYEIVTDPSSSLINDQTQWKDLSLLDYNDSNSYEIYEDSSNNPACTLWSDTAYWDSQLGDILETIDGGHLTNPGSFYYKKHAGTGYAQAPFASTDLVCFARRPTGQYVPKIVQSDNGTVYTAWIREYQNILVDNNGGIGNKVFPIKGDYFIDRCTTAQTDVPIYNWVLTPFYYTYQVWEFIRWAWIVPIFGWVTHTAVLYYWVYTLTGYDPRYTQTCVNQLSNPIQEFSYDIVIKSFNPETGLLSDEIIIYEDYYDPNINQNPTESSQYIPDIDIMVSSSNEVIITYIDRFSSYLQLTKFNGSSSISNTRFYNATNLLTKHFATNIQQYPDFFANLSLYSVDSFKIDEELSGLVLSGHIKDNTTESKEIPTDLYYAVINTSSLIIQSVKQLTEDQAFYYYPTGLSFQSDRDRLFIAVEKYQNSPNAFSLQPVELIGIYSLDGGKTWSDQIPLNFQQSALDFNSNGNMVIKGTENQVIHHRQYYPQLLEENDTLYFLVTEMFLLDQNSTTGYQGIPYGTDYDVVTNLIVAKKIASWYDYPNFRDIRKIAIGDSDNDFFIEILASHGQQVTLIEATNTSDFNIRWQSELFDKNTRDVLIFDANGNNWPEIIFAVEGGDVFAFEIANKSQPSLTEYLDSDLKYWLNLPDNVLSGVSFNISNSELVDLNDDGSLDILVSFNTNNPDKTGIFAFDLRNNNSLWFKSTFGNIYSFDVVNSTFIFVFTSMGLEILDFSGEISEKNDLIPTFLKSNDFYNSSYAFVDIIGDNSPELVTGIFSKDLNLGVHAYNPVTWETIWDSPFIPLKYTTQIDTLGSIKYSHFTSTFFIDQNYISFAMTVTTQAVETIREVYLVNSTGDYVDSHILDFSANEEFRTVLGQFNGDQNLDIALASNSLLQVVNLHGNNLILESSLPETRFSLSHLPIYAKDYTNDQIDELIISIGSYHSNFIPSGLDIPFPDYSAGKGAIFLIDVNTASIIDSEFFQSSITLSEYQVVFGIESYVVSTKNFGTYSVTFSEKPSLWVASLENPEFVAIQVASLKKTFIATTDKDGAILVSELERLTPGRYEIPQLLKYSVKNVTNLVYQQEDKESFFFNPIVIDYDRNGLNELLLAFSNGTIILRSLNNAEIWRVHVGSISQFDAASIKTSKEIRNLIIVNNTALSIITENGQEISLTRALPGTGVLQGKILTVKLGSSYEYEHLLFQIDNKLTLFDPVINRFIWNTTLPGNERIIEYELAILNKALPSLSTHIIALGENGYLSAIALPILENLLGTRNLGVPTSGSWQKISVILDDRGLNRVFAISDQGELMEYYFDFSTDNFDKKTSNINLLSSNYTFKAINQGIKGIDLFVVYPGIGISILQADGIVLYSNDQMGLLDINRSIVVNNFGDGYNLALTLGNQIVVLSPRGKLLEVHSYQSEIKSVTPWRVDLSLAESFVVLLEDGNIAFTDSQGRKITTHSLKIQVLDENFQEEIVIDLETEILEEPDLIINYFEIGIISLILIVFSMIFFVKRIKKRRYF
jgi:hypothetical protein